MRVVSIVALAVVSIGGLACSPTPSGDDEAGVTTNPGSGEGTGGTGTGTSSGTSTSSGTGTSTTSDDGSTDANDLPPTPDVMQIDECFTVWLTWPEVDADYPDCTIVPDNGGGGCWTEPMIGCTPPGPSGCSCPEGDCIGTWSICSGDISGWGESTPGEVCGPFVIDGLCCSIGEFIYGCAE